MKTRKGFAGLVTVAIIASIAVFFIILSSFILMEVPVKTDMQVQLDYKETKFETLIATNQILIYKDQLDKIRKYSTYPENSEELKIEIKKNLRDSTEYLSTALEGRRFRVNITVPEKENISIGSDTSKRTLTKSEITIASPREEPVRMEVSLSD